MITANDRIKLRYIRAKKRMSQEKLAQQLGISRPTLCRIENGIGKNWGNTEIIVKEFIKDNENIK